MLENLGRPFGRWDYSTHTKLTLSTSCFISGSPLGKSGRDSKRINRIRVPRARPGYGLSWPSTGWGGGGRCQEMGGTGRGAQAVGGEKKYAGVSRADRNGRERTHNV